MIQVCSQCGTRWNVRDRQREWCPRCNGALLAPPPQAAHPEWADRSSALTAGHPPAQRLPAGYRWIAVRPGSAPPPRRHRRPLGPTPRYAQIPRWSLGDWVGPPVAVQSAAAPRRGPSTKLVRATLLATMVTLVIAAVVHIGQYALLIINRETLLNPWLAAAATLAGVVVSIAAMLLILASAVLLVRWLIARRSAAYEYYGETESRRPWTLWAGCLIPLVNLVWAPVFVIEAASVEDRYSMLRKSIRVWWILWILSTAVSVFAMATSGAQSAQGIADNTVTSIVAYLFALAAVFAIAQVFLGFERKPVERASHRWVVVRDERESRHESAPAVESEGQEPAA